MAGPLLDHRGRPIETAALRGERLRPTTGGVRSILTSHPTTDLTASKLVAILRESELPGGAQRYLELAEEMEERDLHYLGVLQTRKRQIAQIGVTVEPASDSADHVADAELVESFFERDEIEDELYDVLDAIGKGFSVTEIVWETSERQWMPERLEWRLPQWFDFDHDTGAMLVRRADGAVDAGAERVGAGDWVVLEPWKYVSHQTRAKSGLPIRGGIARSAVWFWFFKNLAIKDWVRFCEAYGMPLRLGKYGPNATDEDRDVLLRAVLSIASDYGAIIPEGMEIEFVEAQSSGAGTGGNTFDDLIGYLDQLLSIAVLGQTLTTKEGEHSGSYALGQVHNNVRHDIERSDGRQLAATLRRDLAIPMVRLNHGDRDAYPTVKIEREEAADLEMLIKAATAFVPLGLRIRTDDLYARTGLQRPDEADEVLEPASQPADPGDGAPGDDGNEEEDQAMARVLRRLPAGRRQALAQALAEDDDDAIDLAVAAALDDWAPVMDPAVAPILDAAAETLAGGGTLAAFRDRLPALFDDMDDAAIARVLHHMRFSAALSERDSP